MILLVCAEAKDSCKVVLVIDTLCNLCGSSNGNQSKQKINRNPKCSIYIYLCKCGKLRNLLLYIISEKNPIISQLNRFHYNRI